jgi:sulfur carrier protein
VITVQINGVGRSFDQQMNVQRLIEQLALGGKKVAVERNGELIARSQYLSCEVLDGDKLEIVVAVGGG